MQTPVRKHEFCPQVVVVDGFPGCGKTMLSPILASLKRVEIANYAFEIEFNCRIKEFGHMTNEAAVAMTRMHVDHRIYNNMMSRDVNFRFNDLSSVFNTPNRFRYFKRLFASGDESIPAKIENLNPILNLTTHDLIQVSGTIFEALGDRLTFINVIRHPLFMLVQQTLNMERLLGNPRDIQVCFDYGGTELPYFANGWEELFIKSNSVERAIYSLFFQSRKRAEFLTDCSHLIKHKFIEIPFELFVKSPQSFMELICSQLGTTFGQFTNREMKRQKVPRENTVDGLPLEIYKRCGWQPPTANVSEQEEISRRRDYAVVNGASTECLSVLDRLSSEYEDYIAVLNHGLVENNWENT